MEIQILTPTQAQPLPPIQWNYQEVKQWISDGLTRYKGVVYTESQIAEAKKDRAQLNKLVQAIEVKRREMKQLYLQPYQNFEAEANELIGMVKEQAAEIDTQVKAYEERRREEKLEKIKTELYAPMIDGLGDLVPYEKLHDPKWLNVTCSVGTIGAEMARKIEGIVAGLEAIDKMGLAPNMASRIKGVFLKKFDLAAAIAEKERIEQMEASLRQYETTKAERNAVSAEQNAHKAEQTANNPEQKYTPPEPAAPVSAQQSAGVTEEKIHTVVFRIHVTAAQLNGLGAYMKANGIKPERVQN